MLASAAVVRTASTATWSLDVQGSETPIAVTWDPSLFPPGAMTMTSSGGTTVNMKTQSAYTVSTSSTLEITFAPYDPTTIASASQTVNAGWELWGLSYDVGAVPYTTLLPLAQEGSLLGYDGAYETVERAHPGRAYWVNFTGAGTETIDGYPLDAVTLQLEDGWNLITGPDCTVDLPASIIAAYVYENGSYTSTTTTSPFEGTWVNVSGPTVLSLDCGASSTLASATQEAVEKGASGTSSKADTKAIAPRMSLHLSDDGGAEQVLHVTGKETATDVLAAYLLPPRPPASVFDARFVTDSRIHRDRTAAVALQSSAYPITVRVTGEAAAGTAVEMTGDATGRTHVLRDGTSFAIQDATVDALRLDLPESVLKDLPNAFALKGNYPNPFRDATRIVLDLPQEAAVTLEVYNILGQKVARIDDQKISSGVDQVLPVQASLASGVYLYRLRAVMDGETVTKTGKMMVVR